MEEREYRQRADRYPNPEYENGYSRPRYGLGDRGEGGYYEARPYARVKTCIEYENGEEFCRYRN